MRKHFNITVQAIIDLSKEDGLDSSENCPIKSSKDLTVIIQDKEHVHFLKKNHLLASECDCANCKLPMQMRNYDKVSDKFTFYCRKCKKIASLRTNRFLEKTLNDL